MVVENRTELSGDEVNEILTKTAKRGILQKFIPASIIFILGLVILILGLVSNKALVALGAIFTALGLVYYLYNVINIRRANKLVLKKNEEEIRNGVTYNYKFKEQSFSLVALSAFKRGRQEYKYNQLKKVIERENYYELYLVQNEIIYVFKNGFQNERMEGFFLKNLKINKIKIKNLEKAND